MAKNLSLSLFSPSNLYKGVVFFMSRLTVDTDFAHIIGSNTLNIPSQRENERRAAGRRPRTTRFGTSLARRFPGVDRLNSWGVRRPGGWLCFVAFGTANGCNLLELARI
jgi:hypothetical protein